MPRNPVASVGAILFVSVVLGPCQGGDDNKGQEQNPTVPRPDAPSALKTDAKPEVVYPPGRARLRIVS